MPSINYYLKYPKETKKKQLIYLFFFYNRPKPFKYSTGEHISPEDWDFRKQRIKPKRSVEYSLHINLLLDKYERKITDIYKTLLLGDGEINDGVLRYEMDIALNKKKRKENLQLMSFLEELIKEKEAIKAKDTSAYRTLFLLLSGYQNTKHTKITYEIITLDFLEKFVAYIETKKTKYDKPYKKSSINTIIDKLKSVLDRAVQNGHNTTLHFKSRNFSVGKERVVREPLTKEELMLIYNVDLSNKVPSYEHIRDTYMIGACTLMRHSDYSELKPEHINDDFIVRHTKKKGKIVILPTHQIIKDILAKYNGKPPTKYSNANMNKILPKIGELAGINKPVVLSYTEGGKRIEKVVPKYELITSHSARRSGATILKDEDVPITDIKEWN